MRVPFLNEEARATVAFGHQPAKEPQADNIVKQLSKLGATPYTCQESQGFLYKQRTP
ncbi:MAG: DUF3656 domain-containing protein [Caryophanon sp.]|nr:DUF3656 domain-containing protein [Caryophanon sp.]